MMTLVVYSRMEFQFTHPVWGATSSVTLSVTFTSSFNSRTPCGVRLTTNLEPSEIREFQFTHPVWGATKLIDTLFQSLIVSIHAPRVGCDSPRYSYFFLYRSFNSRTPCGVRLSNISCIRCIAMFQFTHPVWGATPLDETTKSVQAFQFTHPVWGATTDTRRASEAPRRFNSRTPCGVRHLCATTAPIISKFQFTHPVWGATFQP